MVGDEGSAGTSEAIAVATLVEKWLCPKCLEPNEPNAVRCMRCGGPIMVYGGTYESALAEGWILGEAGVARRPGWVPVLGLWLACIPYLLLPLFLLSDSTGILSATGIAMLVLAGSGALLFGWLAIRATRRFLRVRSDDALAD